MGCSTNCNAATVSKNFLVGPPMWLKHRTGWNGQYGVHGGAHSERFNSTFHRQAGYGMGLLNYFAYYYGGGAVTWVGDIGVQVCKTGCHSTGKAIDITAVRFHNGFLMDSNVAWRPNRPLSERRRYLAVWAAMRHDCTTVISAQYNDDHHNHFHVDIDDDVTPPPLRTWAGTDTLLIQVACNWLNAENLVTDGIWGYNTSYAYNSLIHKFHMTCKNPLGNYWHMREFLQLVVLHGVTNRSAGGWRSSCGF